MRNGFSYRRLYSSTHTQSRDSLDLSVRTASWWWRAYFTAVCFFRRLISEVTERISTKLGHIHLWQLFKTNLVRTPPGIYPHGLLGQKTFLGPTLNFDRTFLCNGLNGTWYEQSERFLSIYTTCPKFVELWPRKSWERLASFCPPTYIFALVNTASHWHTAWTLYNRQQ